MRVLIPYIAVFCGAGIGGLLRDAVNRLGLKLGAAFPWTTLFINVSGGLAMGLITGWFVYRGLTGHNLRLFLTTGLLGGYTTFSAFSLEAVLLWDRGQAPAAAVYMASSVALSVGAAFLGLVLIRQLPG